MTSHFDQIIPPEITADDFSYVLRHLAATTEIDTVLEIGASSGAGSTEALLSGVLANPRLPRLFSIEVSKPRYDALAARHAIYGQFQAWHASSVGLSAFPSEETVAEFYRTTPSVLNHYPLEDVLGWLREDIRYIKANAVPEDGIERIRQENGIETFGMVLIDGSEFTGEAELDAVYGARIIALDDVMGYKNMNNARRLLADKEYDLIVLNKAMRHGHAIFRRR